MITRYRKEEGSMARNAIVNWVK